MSNILDILSRAIAHNDTPAPVQSLVRSIVGSMTVGSMTPADADDFADLVEWDKCKFETEASAAPLPGLPGISGPVEWAEPDLVTDEQIEAESALRERILRVTSHIDRFAMTSEEDECTDTGEAWEVISEAKQLLLDLGGHI